MPSSTLMIYGASGYTGRMVSEHAKNLDLKTILAGQTEAKLSTLAEHLDLEKRAFGLADPAVLDTNMSDVSVLLNCAGPFMRTAKPLMEACIRNKIHYLDVAAELDSYVLAESLDARAREENIMLLPGCGGSVAMLGCLAGYAMQHVTKPTQIDVAMCISGALSRGSLTSATENISPRCLQRAGDELVDYDSAGTELFDFADGRGAVPCPAVTLPDLITIAKSTGAPAVRTFAHFAGGGLGSLPDDMASMPEGPSAEERKATPCHAAVRVAHGEEGDSTRAAVLHAANGYSFTAAASAEAARRVLQGEGWAAGFQTPAGVFGFDFVRSVLDSELQMVES